MLLDHVLLPDTEMCPVLNCMCIYITRSNVYSGPFTPQDIILYYIPPIVSINYTSPYSHPPLHHI